MTLPVKHRGFYVCLFLSVATLAVYYPVMSFDFVNLMEIESQLGRGTAVSLYFPIA